MTPELHQNVQLLAKLLLDARLVAGAVLRQAQLDGEPYLGDYNFLTELAAMRERVKQLLEQIEEGSR